MCCLQRVVRSAGYTAAQLFGQGSTYTYDDVIFLPGHIDFGAHEVLLASLLENFPWNTPITIDARACNDVQRQTSSCPH